MRLYKSSGLAIVLSFSLLSFCIIASGCSYQYVDTYGTRHVWGLVHMESRDIEKEKSDVHVQQVSTMGFAVLRLPEQSGVSLGYTRNFSIQVDDNVAGEISLNLRKPTEIAYKDFDTLWKENQ